MNEVAAVIQAISSLLWPVFAFVVVFMFRHQLTDVLAQLKRMKRGKLFGQEIELSDILEEDDSSRILNAYLLPGGVYSAERQVVLNSLLSEMGVARDVRLILDGADDVALRKRLIKSAKAKGFALDEVPSAQALS